VSKLRLYNGFYQQGHLVAQRITNIAHIPKG